MTDRHASYYWITQAFQSTTGSIANLVTGIQSMKSDCSDTTLLGSFMENHDQPRFASYTSDMSLAKNAIAYTMLADGIPIIYAGQEQHYSGGTVPKNREAIWTSGYDTTAELYKHIASLNELRSWAVNQSSTWVTYQADVAYSDDSTIAVRKGPAGAQTVGVYTNAGASGGDTTVSIPSSGTGFTATQALVDVIACKAYTTDSNGALSASLSGGLPAVFYPKAGLSGSGICPDAS